MQIIDKYAYLENALGFIGRNIIEGKNLTKIAQKMRIDVKLLNNLSSQLVGFSERNLVTALQEKLEERHSSLGGADAELTFADVGVDIKQNQAFVLIYFNWELVVDGEIEDKAKMAVELFSKNNVKIEFL